MKQIRLIEGVHITATEKRSILQMLEKGFKIAHNKPSTKSYEILKNEDGFLTVKIGSHQRWGFNTVMQWRYNTIKLEIIES